MIKEDQTPIGRVAKHQDDPYYKDVYHQLKSEGYTGRPEGTPLKQRVQSMSLADKIQTLAETKAPYSSQSNREKFLKEKRDFHKTKAEEYLKAHNNTSSADKKDLAEMYNMHNNIAKGLDFKLNTQTLASTEVTAAPTKVKPVTKEKDLSGLSNFEKAEYHRKRHVTYHDKSYDVSEEKTP